MFGASIGLTEKQVLKIMAEADNNDNGVIEYREFLPVATEIIQVKTRFFSSLFVVVNMNITFLRSLLL